MTQTNTPKIGEPFSPYERFHILPMPDSVLRSEELSPGAKLLYGRLCRYVGKNLFCWPAVATLAALLGVGERQIQNYLKERSSANLPVKERSAGHPRNSFTQPPPRYSLS